MLCHEISCQVLAYNAKEKEKKEKNRRRPEILSNYIVFLLSPPRPWYVPNSPIHLCSLTRRYVTQFSILFLVL